MVTGIVEHIEAQCIKLDIGISLSNLSHMLTQYEDSIIETSINISIINFINRFLFTYIILTAYRFTIL